jgi:hypothetical protein
MGANLVQDFRHAFHYHIKSTDSRGNEIKAIEWLTHYLKGSFEIPLSRKLNRRGRIALPYFEDVSYNEHV